MKNKMAKTAIIVTVFTFLSKFLGFIREGIIAYFFGASQLVDAYLMAISLPSLLLGFFTCFATAFTPLYIEQKEKSSKSTANKYMNSVLIFVGVVSICFISLTVLFAPQIIKIATPGFSEEQIKLTTVFFKISVWDILFLSILNIYASFLQANDKFSYVSASMLFHSLIQIIFTLCAGFLNVIFLVYGYVFADVIYLFVLVVFSVKNGYKFYGFEFNHIKNLIILVFPIFISSMLTVFNSYIDKVFATYLNEGVIACLNYANMIITFIVMMLNTGLVTMIYPYFSKLITNNDMYRLNNLIIKALKYIIILFTPSTIGLFFLATPVVELLFGRGAFGEDAIVITSNILKFYSFSIFMIGIYDILFRLLYASKKSSVVLFSSVITVFTNVFFNFIFVKKFGYSGIALGTTLSYVITIVILYFNIKKLYNTFHLKELKNTIRNSIIASFAMGLFLFVIQAFIHLKNNLLLIIISLIVGSMTYFACYIILDPEIKNTIIQNVKGKNHFKFKEK